jgi:hypothetical protein
MKIQENSNQSSTLAADIEKLTLNERKNRRSSGVWNNQALTSGSSRKNLESDHHEFAINLALKNKYPVIAEMILRDITLKDAVRGDEMNQLKRKVQQAITSNIGIKR